jgi:hypothetical protein
VFLFNGLFFLITSLSLSMPMYSGGFVEKGLSKANTDVLSVLVLCLDNPSCFLLISSESARDVCGRGLLAMKTVWGRDSGVGKVIWILFGLGEGVLSLRLFISII